MVFATACNDFTQTYVTVQLSQSTYTHLLVITMQDSIHRCSFMITYEVKNYIIREGTRNASKKAFAYLFFFNIKLIFKI